MNSDENSLNFYPYLFPPFVNLSDYFYLHLSFCHWLSTPICVSQTVCVYLLYLTTYLSLSVRLPQSVFIFIHLCSVFLPITLYLS